MKDIRYILLLIYLFSFTCIHAEKKETGHFDPKAVIFEHLTDEYGWKIWELQIPLPVIVKTKGGKWHIFSSKHITKGETYQGFYLAPDGKYAGKIVATDKNGKQYRPWDFSVTKNALSLIICSLILCWLLFPLVRWYKKHPYAAPHRVKGMIEATIEMLYKDVICSVLGTRAKQFAPYLLTVFFFILVANLLGLMVIFPGGTNLMGNISVTMVLALCTFCVVNFSGRRQYWKEIFWPEVPTWLKIPIPMMPVIEIFGLFTKPLALMIRLFANILGGHLITLVLISLIFIFSAFGTAVASGTTAIAVIFAVFMGMIDLLICFIQAYVFFMLSTIFIAIALPEEK